jgi:hypothetical protein
MNAPINQGQKRMRVTRAYIAGFGTAGSLLAGASVLFVMATAFVSYRGWPQVAYTGPPPALVLAHKTYFGVRPSVARPVLTADAAQPAASRGAAAPAARRSTAVAHPRQRTVTTLATTGVGHGVKHHVPATVLHAPPSTGGTPTCTGAACTARPTGNGVAGVATSVTGAVGSGVSSTGKSLGSTVTAVSGALASKLSGVNPGVSNLVSGAGQALGNAVTQATQAAGGAVAGTGQLLGGILGAQH